MRRPASGSGPGTIHLVSPLGGPARGVSDFPTKEQLSWSPDGRGLAASRAPTPSEPHPDDGAIHLISISGAEPRRLTRPELEKFDWAPAFSPDGRRLAFASCAGLAPWWCEIRVLDLDADLVPRPPPRAVARPGWTVSGLAWTRDGASVIYRVEEGAFLQYLWRVDAAGRRPPERIEMAGVQALDPVVAPSRDRLAFARHHFDIDICRFAPGHDPQVVLGSSFFEGSSDFSPDGHRIAFESARSAERMEIWLGRRVTGRAAHAGTGTLAGLAAVVAGRPPDRLRLLGRERVLGHLDDRGRRGPTAAPHVAPGQREPAELVP